MKRLAALEAIRTCAVAVGGDAEFILDELNRGVAEAWQVGEVCFITRVEIAAGNKELVVVCSQGKGLVSAGDAIVLAAKNADCKTIRFHTNRPAQQRLLNKFNFRELERVYVMEL